MRTIVIPVLFALCLALAACGDHGTQPAVPAGHITWQSTSVLYDTTIEKKDHSLLLISATWCGWCRKLKTQALTDPMVAKLVTDSFNAVKVEVDVDSSVVYRDTSVSCSHFGYACYGVTAYPTVLILDRRADSLGHILGYCDAATFRTRLLQIIDGK